MTSPRLATYSIGGATRYGAVTDAGIVDLSARFGQDIRRCAKPSRPAH